MRKMKTNKLLAATALAVTVAAFGCTTNRYRGNGEPTITTPGYGAANQAVTPGSSSGTEGNPPMASSYVGIPQPNTDVLAEAAARQAYRGRLLGVVNPGGTQAGPVATGGQVNLPALATNPRPTINASVSSSGVPAITGDAVDEAIFLSAVGGATATTAAATSGAATTVATTGASTAATSPLMVAGAVGVGATPASGTVVPATSATSLTSAVKGTTTASTTMPATAKATTASTTAKAASIPATSGLKIQQSTNGQIVVSNATSGVPSTKASTTTPSVKP